MIVRAGIFINRGSDGTGAPPPVETWAPQG
jgi:hypothetical protein